MIFGAVRYASIGAIDSPQSLKADGKLFKGQSVFSTDKRLQLTMQEDGNLVLYLADGNFPLWSSGTSDGYYAIMQTDGNFVVYNFFNKPTWNSQTHGNPGAFLSLQSDGNMVVYRPDKTPLWSTQTSIAPANPLTAPPLATVTPTSTTTTLPPFSQSPSKSGILPFEIPWDKVAIGAAILGLGFVAYKKLGRR